MEQEFYIPCGFQDQYQAHGDLRCTRVQRVVKQFAHNGGWPLHDFARSDLADQLVGQFKDGAAGEGGEDGVHGAILNSCGAKQQPHAVGKLCPQLIPGCWQFLGADRSGWTPAWI